MDGEDETGQGGGVQSGSAGAGGVEIPCPSCRKSVATPLPAPDDFACPRCRCGLAALAGILSDSASLISEAHAALRCGEYPRALAAAAASWELRHTRAAASAAFIAATVQGDTGAGISWLRLSRGAGLS